jgi:hypothetical protein
MVRVLMLLCLGLLTIFGQREAFAEQRGGGSISLVQAPAQPKVVDADAEADFNLVVQIGTKKAFEVFLETHKTGKYADLARAQLAVLARTGCLATGRNQDASNISLANQAARCAGQRKPNDIERH